MLLAIILSLLLQASAPTFAIDPSAFDGHGGMDLIMGITRLDHHRYGAFSIFKDHNRIDDCIFQSIFETPQTIQLNCTTNNNNSTPDNNYNSSSWEWCGFQWQQPEPDAIQMDFIRCNDSATPNNVHFESSSQTPDAPQWNRTFMRSFLASPIASHFVHLSIVSAANSHPGFDNMAMLQIHHVAKTFIKVAAKEGVDMTQWYNQGDFEELINLANAQYDRRAMMTEEDPDANFKEAVVKPAIRPTATENYAKQQLRTFVAIPVLEDVDHSAHAGRCTIQYSHIVHTT
eukprot:CAMPEP_0116867466 /NCGR_PEP_ID=MMETSP0418-20121206/26641_1 /TAXON_ID=1158023 /ORGANISM="Astrosyne radiata, Strain 13vi08-1A" /LENGTH=286 /DNA_ID=CAMNT_0004503297 /DNA_START=562 /DNA_END=1422 /DNA_ORIENTATION=+